MRIADDDVRLVEGRVDRLPIHQQVLAVLDELVLIPVELQAAGLGVPGLVLLGLFPAIDPGIGAIHRQGRNALLGLLLQVREAEAGETGAAVDDALDYVKIQFDINRINTGKYAGKA